MMWLIEKIVEFIVICVMLGVFIVIVVFFLYIAFASAGR